MCGTCLILSFQTTSQGLPVENRNSSNVERSTSLLEGEQYLLSFLFIVLELYSLETCQANGNRQDWGAAHASSQVLFFFNSSQLLDISRIEL